MKQNQAFLLWDKFKFDFLSKNIKAFQCFAKSKFLSFMTKVKPNNENETKSDIFSCVTYSNLTSLFIGHKIPKYFNDFYN